MAKSRTQTGITRSRTGCLTCRRRHIKCDEVTPVCGRCAHLQVHCEEYSPTLVFRDDTLTVKRRSQRFQAQRWATINAQDQQRKARHRPRLENPAPAESTPTTPSPGQSPSQRPGRRPSHSPEERLEGPSSLTFIRKEHEAALHSEAGSPTASNETRLESAGSADLRLGLNGTAGRPPISETSSLAELSSTVTPPIQEPAEDTEQRGPTQSNTSPLKPSVVVEQSSSGPDAGPAKPTESCTSGSAQSSYWDILLTTGGSMLSQSATPDTEIMVPTQSPTDLGDWWLNRSEMPGLPTVYKHVWDYCGQSNEALKYALLALAPASPSGPQDSPTGRSRRIECYSMALHAMTQTCQAGAQISDIGIELAILSLFLVIEIRLGTFKGGTAHSTRSDVLVTQNYRRLGGWHIGRELLCTWLCTRSWYYAQYVPWRATAAEPTESLRQLLTPILHTSPNRNRILVPLLCQCWHVNEQVVLARLIGVNGKWPGFRYWCHQLESLNVHPPALDAGMYGDPNVAEEQRLAELNEFRAELDGWHASLTIQDLPNVVATSETIAQLHRQPSALRLEPLYFRNHQAALGYLRYAAAQTLCSTEAIAEITGGALVWHSQPNLWINICLRIIAGLDRAACLEDDPEQIGLTWIITRVILLRGLLDVNVVETIESWLPWLEDICAIPGSTCPAWCLRGMLRKIKEERARGRYVFSLFSDVQPTSEWTEIFSMSSVRSMKVLIIGRVAETGLPFREIVDIPCA